jgi:hypothetical protein
MVSLIRLAASLTLGLTVPASVTVSAATLKPQTITAFDRYIAESERQAGATLGDPARFLSVTAATDLAGLRRGQLSIDKVEIKSSGKKIDIPDGMIHHWIGVVFVPGATADEAVRLLQDYDRHQDIYKPNVARSKLLSHTGDQFKMSLRFYMKKVITVVVNSDHEARFSRPEPGRAHSRIASTRIAEVEDPDTPHEKELPVGNDGGYLWRLNSYWRFLERDGGTYVQCESITLTRGLPMIIGAIIRPFVTSIPRETLTFTLETTRKALAAKLG